MRMTSRRIGRSALQDSDVLRPEHPLGDRVGHLGQSPGARLDQMSATLFAVVTYMNYEASRWEMVLHSVEAAMEDAVRRQVPESYDDGMYVMALAPGGPPVRIAHWMNDRRWVDVEMEGPWRQEELDAQDHIRTESVSEWRRFYG